jgi:AraC-like DNA-binding protein
MGRAKDGLRARRASNSVRTPAKAWKREVAPRLGAPSPWATMASKAARAVFRRITGATPLWATSAGESRGAGSPRKVFASPTWAVRRQRSAPIAAWKSPTVSWLTPIGVSRGAANPRNLGRLSGLNDPPVGRALTGLHEDPARRWTVEALARTAGLSRSAFAVRFAEVVGQTPLTYLAAWRLDLAADQLKSGSALLANKSESSGEQTEIELHVGWASPHF